MSAGGAANNSWTILTSEETVAETLRPSAEGTKQPEESHTSATEPVEENQSTKERLPDDGCPVSEEKTADQSADLNSGPISADASGTLDHGDVEGSIEGLTRSCLGPDSSSDSYTLLTPSPDGPPISLLSTETLGSAEFSQAEEELPQEETINLKNKEEPHQEEAASERTENDEPEVRRRKSLLEQIGRKEEEEVEEEFQVPQQENDSIFSLNKCILAALILLGLGTLFFSEGDYATRELMDSEAAGRQEWLSSEVPPGLDPSSSELLNKLAEGSQQIPSLQAQLQAQKEELKVAKEQAVEGVRERLLWEEESRRFKMEIASLPVLQEENDRMKKELELFPALQKELEALRSTETNLKLTPANQADQASITPSTFPSCGQTENGRPDEAGPKGKKHGKTWENQRQKKDLKSDNYGINDKKQQKEKQKSPRKEVDENELKKGAKMEWKKGKPEQGKLEKDKDKPGKQKREGDEKKQSKQKDVKKGKGGRGDEGRPWKDKEGRKEWKEEKGWKKLAFEKVHEDKERTGKLEKEEWRGGKHNHQNPMGEIEWKKGKHVGKEKGERKDWKEKRDKDPEWMDKIGKDYGKEGKGKGERKQWDHGKSQGKERVRKEEGKLWNEYEAEGKNRKQEMLKSKHEISEEFKIKGVKLKKIHNVEWEKYPSQSLKKENPQHAHQEEHLYGEPKPQHSHPKPSVGQPEYWVLQRERLQHDPNPPRHCDTVETCAQVEGLHPVPLSEFETVLQAYLTKAAQAGVDGSKTSELRKLTQEFFKDGMFVHNQRSFQDFVDDLADILEDLVEGNDGSEDDSDLEDEMEGFEKEVLKRFSLSRGGEKEKRIKGEWRKENRQ